MKIYLFTKTAPLPINSPRIVHFDSEKDRDMFKQYRVAKTPYAIIIDESTGRYSKLANPTVDNLTKLLKDLT